MKSEHLQNHHPAPALYVDADLIAAPDLIEYFARRGVELAAVSLRTVADAVVYDVMATDGARLLVDAWSGEILTPIGHDVAARIAQLDRAVDGEAQSVDLMEEPDSEYRGETPVWRVSYDDEDQARIYVSPVTGEIVGRTNSTWRIRDFVWMLHIMDYDTRLDYNNNILRVVAVFGSLFALTGIAVLATTVRRRRRPVSEPGKTWP